MSNFSSAWEELSQAICAPISVLFEFDRKWKSPQTSKAEKRLLNLTFLLYMIVVNVVGWAIGYFIGDFVQHTFFNNSHPEPKLCITTGLIVIFGLSIGFILVRFLFRLFWKPAAVLVLVILLFIHPFVAIGLFIAWQLWAIARTRVSAHTINVKVMDNNDTNATVVDAEYASSTPTSESFSDSSSEQEALEKTDWTEEEKNVHINSYLLNEMKKRCGGSFPATKDVEFMSAVIGWYQTPNDMAADWLEFCRHSFAWTPELWQPVLDAYNNRKSTPNIPRAKTALTLFESKL